MKNGHWQPGEGQTWPCWCPDLGFIAPRTLKKKMFAVCKPLSLWYWLGQKSVYRKTQTNLLANPILCYSSLSRLRLSFSSRPLWDTNALLPWSHPGHPGNVSSIPALSLVTQNDPLTSSGSISYFPNWHLVWRFRNNSQHHVLLLYSKDQPYWWA